MPEPAYTRLNVDERRRQVLAAGSQLFAEHAFEEITMRQIAEAAGISKGLLYHYFPSKTELFKAAVSQHASDLQQLITRDGQGSAAEQLSRSLDAYLQWIEANSRTWTKLMQSAATLPEAAELLSAFRTRTLDQILEHLTTKGPPSPVLRNALKGWLGYVDATLLDWTQEHDLARSQVHQLILAAFGAALLAAQQTDPDLQLKLT
jgi:AcrR family transcriptional regulator